MLIINKMKMKPGDECKSTIVVMQESACLYGGDVQCL